MTVLCLSPHIGGQCFIQLCLSDGHFSFPLSPSSGTQFLPHNILSFSHLLIYLFTYFWLYWIFTAARGLFSSSDE